MGRYKNSGNGVGTRGNPQQSLEQDNFSNKNQDTSSVMPNYDKATIDDRKFLEYSLNLNSLTGGKDKAIAYKNALGYDITNYKDLIKQIETKVKSGMHKPVSCEYTNFGVKYRYELPITGPNGKTKTVIAVFQIDIDKNIPRLVTNYVKKKGGK